MNVLVVDVGGTHVKVLVTGEQEPRKFSSGPTLTAGQMVAGVKKVTGDWKYDAVSIGFPGSVLRNRPVAEPRNLGGGWVGFNFRSAFGFQIKLVNDAAMQGLGSYRKGIRRAASKMQARGQPQRISRRFSLVGRNR